MFKYLERLEEKEKSTTDPSALRAIQERTVAIEAFIDNCAMVTLTDAAVEMRIDIRLFDLPLLSSILQLSPGEELPKQLEMDFAEDAVIVKDEPEVKDEPVKTTEDLEETVNHSHLELDYTHPEIIRIMNALYTGLASKDDHAKYLRAASSVTRKKLSLPDDVDDYSIIEALTRPHGLYKLPKFEEFAKKLYKIGQSDGHAIGALIEVKKLLPEWSDDSIANMVRHLISTVASGNTHHDILDCDRKVITDLTKNVDFIASLAEAWPQVHYCRVDKTTKEMKEEILPCTEIKAAAFHIAHLYGLSSPKKQAKLAFTRKNYVEKGYPA